MASLKVYILNQWIDRNNFICFNRNSYNGDILEKNIYNNEVSISHKSRHQFLDFFYIYQKLISFSFR